MGVLLKTSLGAPADQDFMAMQPLDMMHSVHAQHTLK